MSVASRVIAMRETSEVAKRALLDEITPYLEKTKIRAVGHDVLIAMYNRAGKQTAGGLFIPDSNREDEYQGKVGLIVGMGPLCRGEAFEEWFGGEPPIIHDWIGINVRDGMSMLVGKTACRLVEWKFLRFPTVVPDLTM